MTAAALGTTLVVAAMPAELAPLRRALVAPRRLGGLWSGKLDAAELLLVVTGEGAGRARAGLEQVLDRQPVARVLVLGVSGALDPELAAGDLLIGREVRHDDGRPAPAPDAALVAAALALPARPATLITTPHIVASAAAKRAAHERHGAPAAAAVDLETAALADVAARRGVPYAALRAVSDPATSDLPLDFERLRRADGSVSRSRVALALLCRPASLPAALALQRTVGRCAERLAGALQRWLEALGDGAER